MTVYSVSNEDATCGIFSSYQKAVAYVMMKIKDGNFLSGFERIERTLGIDCFYFSNGDWYTIEEFEVDSYGQEKE